MVHPEIAADELILRVQGADRLWSLRSELRIPLSHITGVRLDAEVVQNWWHGLKVAGTDLPHVITAGTFYQHGQRVFWDIHHPEQAVVLSLAHEFYQELVVEVADPESFVAELAPRLAANPPETGSR